MRRLTAWLSLLALSSCKFMDDWAAASVPAQDGTPPAGDTGFPTIGGSDPLDIVVTVLTLFGLPAAARILLLAKPLVSPLLRMFWPRKVAAPTVPPEAPAQPSPVDRDPNNASQV